MKCLKSLCPVLGRKKKKAIQSHLLFSIINFYRNLVEPKNCWFLIILFTIFSQQCPCWSFLRGGLVYGRPHPKKNMCIYIEYKGNFFLILSPPLLSDNPLNIHLQVRVVCKEEETVWRWLDMPIKRLLETPEGQKWENHTPSPPPRPLFLDGDRNFSCKFYSTVFFIYIMLDIIYAGKEK